MASLQWETELRPCYVAKYTMGNDRNHAIEKSFEVKGLCHGIFAIADVIAPSPLKGGHPGGQISSLMALVEFEDGTLQRVNVEDIQFCDNKFRDYAFPEKEGSDDLSEM